MNTQLQPGLLIQVIDSKSLAFGRYGYILRACDNRAEIEFADLPSISSPTSIFEGQQLKPITNIPLSPFYLLVEILTLVGTKEYKRYVIAHAQSGQSPQDIAETIAAMFFGSLGSYDGEFYIWEQTPYAARLSYFEQISVAQYAELRRTTPDHNLGADILSKHS